MRLLDLRGDAKRERVAAANCTETEEIKIPAGQVISGKTAKISFASIRILQPTVVDAIEVHNFGLQAPRFQHRSKAQDADWSQLPHDASCFHFAHAPVIELVGRGRADEANLHGYHALACDLCELLPAP